MKIVAAKVKEGKCYIVIDQEEEALADDVILMVLGKGDSEGFAILDHDKAIYISQTQSDLQSIIGELIQLTGDLISMTTDKGYVKSVTGGGGDTPPTVTMGTPPGMSGISGDLKSIKKRLEEFKPK